MTISRRHAMLALAGAAIAPASTGASSVSNVWQRRYRASATITLLSVPLVSKSGVGSGFTQIEEADGPKGKTIAIQFGAGSWPDSARGLNRLGFIREVLNETRGGDLAECAYFAFMTSSQEKSLEQAKSALEASGPEVSYAIAEGRGSAGAFTSRLDRVSFPSNLTWKEYPVLVDKARAAVASEKPTQRVDKKLASREAAPATFLYAVRKALQTPDSHTNGSLIYNGKEFRLHCEKEADAATGAHFLERGLTRDASRIVRLKATLHEVATGQTTPFKVWYEAGAEHLPPLRFEYQAKSFLRLTFEFDPAASGPPIARALNDKENA